VDLEIRDLVKPRRGGLRMRLSLQLPERTGVMPCPVRRWSTAMRNSGLLEKGSQHPRVILLRSEQGSDGEHLRVAAPDLAPGQRFQLLREE